MAKNVDNLIPSADEVMKTIALAEAEKAAEAFRKHAQAEAEKKAEMARLAGPSGLSDEEKVEIAANVIGGEPGIGNLIRRGEFKTQQVGIVFTCAAREADFYFDRNAFFRGDRNHTDGFGRWRGQRSIINDLNGRDLMDNERACLIGNH